MSVMKTNSKNAKSQFQLAKIPPENPKTQLENAKTQKNRASFPGQTLKKSPVRKRLRHLP